MHRLNDQTGTIPIGLVIALTVVMTILMGGTVHYTLKAQEASRVTQLMAEAQAAGEQKAIAISQVFASLGSGLVQSDLFRIQEMLQAGFVHEGLVDAVVLDSDNMIVAAKNSAQIGQHVQDIAWLSQRAQNKEIVSRTVDHTQRLLVTVVEPMKEKEETVAWAKMSFAISQPVQSVRTPSQRLKETAKFVGPLAIVLFVGMLLVARLAGSSSDESDQSFISQDHDRGSSPGNHLRKVS